ncbi:hypothetical protein CCACVL1_26987 [Corchorus capsularis]|uniref:Uncharacterized protein n=1 Tax=Corchorus capsularis TaxID=210143 RepID=A0A1R3GCL1_COCAP|nr:hypothetical protein CCACVL1_26987 [Corchorus capsularis]
MFKNLVLRHPIAALGAEYAGTIAIWCGIGYLSAEALSRTIMGAAKLFRAAKPAENICNNPEIDASFRAYARELEARQKSEMEASLRAYARELEARLKK